MASRQPFVRQTAWVSLVPHVAVGGIIVAVTHLLKAPMPILFGVLLYLCLSLSLNRLFPVAQRRGVGCLKKQDFAGAIPEFENSYEFFTRHRWLDDFRYVVLLSSSRVAYREMALLNIAYCYGQLGDGAKSKEYCQRTLAEFPDSEMAKGALRMFESAEGAREATDSPGEE